MIAKRLNIHRLNDPHVLYANDLTLEAITKLLSPDSPILAVVINNFTDLETCRTSSNKIRNSSQKSSYKVASGIKREGDAIYDAANDPDQLLEYLKNIPKNHQRTRGFFGSDFTPIDKLRLQMQELWPKSSTLGTFSDTPAYAGLIRHFMEGCGGADPHSDVVGWDLPSDPTAQSMSTQLAGNIYLTMPKEGGNLSLWDFGLFPQKTYQAFRDANSKYALDASLLPQPKVTITPEVGQLILFNANFIHSVSKCIGGDRITTSAFIGYASDEQPLKFFS